MVKNAHPGSTSEALIALAVFEIFRERTALSTLPAIPNHTGSVFRITSEVTIVLQPYSTVSILALSLVDYYRWVTCGTGCSALECHLLWQCTAIYHDITWSDLRWWPIVTVMIVLHAASAVTCHLTYIRSYKQMLITRHCADSGQDGTRTTRLLNIAMTCCMQS